MLGIKYTRQERDWVLYDVGNSALFMLITALIPLYFNSILEGSQASDNIVVIWANAQTITSIIVAILMPVLGSFADYPGRKVRFFNTFFIMGLLGCLALAIPMGPTPFLVVFVLMNIGLNASLTFYDAMLVDVTTEEKMDVVSSSGYAWGYIGSVVPFILSVVVFMAPGIFGISESWGQRLPFILTGVWWLLFTIPMLRSYKQKYSKPIDQISVKKTFVSLYKTAKDIKKDRRLFVYVLAYFFYIDGVHTVISMSASYGIALNIKSDAMLLAFLLTQFVAFPSAIIYGRLANKFGCLKMVRIAVAAYVVGVLFAAFFLKTALEFFMLAVLIGLFQGGVQALSRSYFGKIIPKDRSNEYYGFFNIFGRCASIVGTIVVGFVTYITSNSSIGVLSIGILLIVGYVLLMQVEKLDVQDTESSMC